MFLSALYVQVHVLKKARTAVGIVFADDSNNWNNYPVIVALGFVVIHACVE